MAMKVLFFTINSDEQERVSAVADISDNGVAWSGDYKNIVQEMLKTTKIEGEPFNPANIEHWKALPNKFKSYKFWARISK